MLQRQPDVPVPEFLNPDAFQPSTPIIIVNCLLFFSLILSLLSALSAMIVKQGIRRYEIQGATASLLWQRTRRRTELRMFMNRWRLREVITGIPYTLHLALAIFLSAALLWLYTLNLYTLIPCAVLVALAVMAYLFVGAISFLPASLVIRTDVEKGADVTNPNNVPFTMQERVTFILNPPVGFKPRANNQRRPSIAEITDVKALIDLIRSTEKHGDLIEAFYELRTANWGPLKLAGLLFEYGEDILKKYNAVAKLVWEGVNGTCYLASGSKERARTLCLFIEWFYHQLSVEQRRTLKGWPDSGIAKALIFDPYGMRPVPSTSTFELPSLEDISLGNSVITKLHHVRLGPKESCQMCIADRSRGAEDVRVRIQTADVQVDDTPGDFAGIIRIQNLVSACISSDADCLFYYSSVPIQEISTDRVEASYHCLSDCIIAHVDGISHSHSYVQLRQLLLSLRSMLQETDPRLKWVNELYDSTNVHEPMNI